jgi:vacuolar iron transporter family protein
MHLKPHTEQHFTASATVRDVVIGMADGLTVPFALAAGLTGAIDSPGLIITAGLAEVAAGAIAMGLGGYLAARTDVEHYASERAIEEREIDEIPQREAEEVATVFRDFGLGEPIVQQAVAAICSDRTRWIDFMMKFELGLDPPDPGRARASALTIAGSYIVGGLIPLSPYFFCHSAHTGLLASVAVTVVALAIFGYIKGRFTGKTPVRSAWQTVAVGGLAAGAAFGLARAIGAK